MRRLLLLVGKDLKRKLRAPVGLAVLLAFPLVFAGMLALVFGSGGGTPKVRLVVENRDGGFLASALSSAFTSKQMAEHFDVRTVAKGAGASVIEAGEASALLILPERLTEDVLDGKPVTLELVRNPAEGILPEVAEQLARILAEVLDGGARVLREPLRDLQPYLGKDATAPTDASIVDLSLAIKHTIDGAEGLVFPPAITLQGAFEEKTPEKDGNDTGSLIFLAVLPGVAVYALFLVADNGMRDVLTEGALGTMKRQLAGPLGTGTLLAGKALYSGVLALGALAIFSAVAAVFLRTVPSIPGFLLLSLALILAVVGCSALVYGLAGTERKGATFASAVYLAMGFLGGSFVDVQNLPPFMQAIARWTPFYWATTGYRTLLEKGGGLADVLPAIGVLALVGITLLVAGSFFLRKTVQRGGATA